MDISAQMGKVEAPQEYNTLRAPRIFLGGPFSAALHSDDKGNLTFHDSVLRSMIESAISAIRSTGVDLVSSHLKDGWGEIDFESGFATRDLQWIRECDSYICILPSDSDGQLYRTDGTFVEIGYALATGTDVVLLIDSPENTKWSFFIRDLLKSPLVRVESLDRLMESPEALIFQCLLNNNSPRTRKKITDVRLWNWLQHRVDLPLFVTVGKADLVVYPGIMNPRFSHSPDFLMSFWSIPAGARVLDIGCGCGVLGINALLAGAGELVAVDLNPVAVENTNENLRRNNVSHLGRAMISDVFSGVSGQFDIILFNPPYWGDKPASDLLERASFDSPDHGFLSTGIEQLRNYLKPNGRCFIAHSDQGNLSLLVQKLESANLSIEKLHIQRPDKPDFHVRVGFEVSRKNTKH
jgi:tRNA1(Val) A37 N6-methylase TrmN6